MQSKLDPPSACSSFPNYEVSYDGSKSVLVLGQKTTENDAMLKLYRPRPTQRKLHLEPETR
uniref:Uncharacterized protein n=1 Tax=Anguilla anguilla TaxID=7936 RepID=A0A0E9S189_ANGAN